jgi:hypothetical protein
VDGAAVEVTPSNQVQVSQAIKLVLDMAQRMKDRIHANSDKHLVAKRAVIFLTSLKFEIQKFLQVYIFVITCI